VYLWLKKRELSLETSFHETIHRMIQDYKTAHAISLEDACAIFGISLRTFYGWGARKNGIVSSSPQIPEFIERVQRLLDLTCCQTASLAGKAGLAYHTAGFV